MSGIKNKNERIGKTEIDFLNELHSLMDRALTLEEFERIADVYYDAFDRIARGADDTGSDNI